MIVFCTTCKGRAQHLEQTLPANLKDNRDYAGCKFLLLDYNSTDHLTDYLHNSCRAEIERGRLVIYSYKQPGPFRMAHAKNLAHRLGILEGGDILVNLDADNLTGPGFASYIESRFAETTEETFLWSKMVQGVLPKGISGRIVVTSRQFLNAGGYDERYETWGPDDKDFQTRLRRMGYAPRQISHEHLKAVLHNNKMRFKEYPEAQTLMGSDQFHGEIYESEMTVVNFGRFGEGIVFRNFDFSAPIQLGPLPTRIFGIGMHKTATTSLHKAMKLLGIDSAHWKTAHWAKAIWEEMLTAGRSNTLERNYALSDLPIPLLYKELDSAYPGSKFILTVRSETAWIESVQKHWSHQHNQFRGAWDTDPFTHRVHKLLYGQRNFDAELFLTRYRQHNREVVEYFRERQSDLLIMDMDAGAGWQELCGFLGRPLPRGPYPRAYATESGQYIREILDVI